MKFTNMKTKVAVLALSLLALNSSNVFSSPTEEAQCGALMGTALGVGLFDETNTRPFVEHVEEVVKILKKYEPSFDSQTQHKKSMDQAKVLYVFIKKIKKADFGHALKIGNYLDKLYNTLPKHVLDAFEAAFLKVQAEHMKRSKQLDKMKLGAILIKRINKTIAS